ncbi:MAG: hypothetical protein V4638_01160 [Bacteroidota bacterium]
MKITQGILASLLVLFALTSCVEIIDDISINNDGSGTVKYTINLSSSKIKINSILALDSLDGRRVPKRAELEENLTEFQKKLDDKTGISNVIIDQDFTNFIFKFQCDFKSVEALQKALKEIITDEEQFKNVKAVNHDWLNWDGTKLTRSIPDFTYEVPSSLKQEDLERLKEGTYTSITRFQRPVDKFENTSAALSKNKMAVMIKTTPYLLKDNHDLIENTIFLSPLK